MGYVNAKIDSKFDIKTIGEFRIDNRNEQDKRLLQFPVKNKFSLMNIISRHHIHDVEESSG